MHSYSNFCPPFFSLPCHFISLFSCHFFVLLSASCPAVSNAEESAAVAGGPPSLQCGGRLGPSRPEMGEYQKLREEL